MKKLLILAFIIGFGSSLEAQKAALYSVKFDVSAFLRREIQKTDEVGNKLWTTDVFGDRVPDTYAESLSRMEVVALCESISEMLKRKLNYEDVELYYANAISLRISPDRLPQFPQKDLNQVIGASDADHFVEITIKIAGRPGSGPKVVNFEKEPWIILDLESSFTIYDRSKNIVKETSFHISEFNELYGSDYTTSIKKGKYKVHGKSWLTTEDIADLYKLCESRYDLLLADLD